MRTTPPTGSVASEASGHVERSVAIQTMQEPFEWVSYYLNSRL
jgi:hypothetical protein